MSSVCSVISPGNPDELLPKLKDRKFVEIDRDNFNTVLAGMKPRLAYRVDNKLTNDDSKIGVELRFKSWMIFIRNAWPNSHPHPQAGRGAQETSTSWASWMATTSWKRVAVQA